jgi:hypothetical protein
MCLPLPQEFDLDYTGGRLLGAEKGWNRINMVISGADGSRRGRSLDVFS